MAGVSLFAAVRDAAARPDARAVSSTRGTWTYAELLDAAERLAGHLDRAAAGTPVVAVLRDIATTAVVTLAADLAGTPVVHTDPTAPDLPAGLRVSDDVDGSAGTVALREGVGLRLAPVDGPTPSLAGLAGAQVFRTSGSTGTPTAVVRHPAVVLADARRVAEPLGYADGAGVVASAPVFHVYGHTYALIAPLLSGAAVHHCGWRSVPSQLARAVRQTGAHTLVAHPFQYGLLGDVAPADAPDFGPLRRAVSAGAPLPGRTVRAVLARHGFALWNCYGSSEAGAVSLGPVTGDEPPGDAGVPLPGVEAALRPEPGFDRGGELVLRTGSLAAGHLDGSGLTPLATHEGGYRTGDLAELTGGRIRLLGRLGTVINVAGKKVSPAEVERVLAEHPAVREAQVFAQQDGTRGQVPHARVVADPGVTAAQLLAWCRQRLAPFQLPRRIEFLAELPRSATGKVVRARPSREEP